MKDPNSNLIVKAWAIVLALSSVAAVVQLKETNAWAPDPSWDPVFGIEVAQSLTDEEIIRVAQWTVDNAKEDVISRIKRTPGYDLDLDDLSVYPTWMVRAFFRDFEWAPKAYFRGLSWDGRGVACLWCLNKRQGPAHAPHYRSHKPLCPVDMVCSGKLRSMPLDPSVELVQSSDGEDAMPVEFPVIFNSDPIGWVQSE